MRVARNVRMHAADNGFASSALPRFAEKDDPMLWAIVGIHLVAVEAVCHEAHGDGLAGHALLSGKLGAGRGVPLRLCLTPCPHVRCASSISRGYRHP